MRIESDIPLGVVPEVELDVTTEHTRASTGLDYETWSFNENSRTYRVKCYDAAGAAVGITLDERIVQEMVFGRIQLDE